MFTGDPRRPILQKKLIESKYQIEMDLKQTQASKSRHWKVENMKSAVDDWANNSAQQLENRLDRLWKHKQREKDERMKKIRKIHQKEIKALERKCSIKNDRLVMKSGSKSRVQVEFGYHFSGSGRVRVTIFGFLSGNYHRVNLRFFEFSYFQIF